MRVVAGVLGRLVRGLLEREKNHALLDAQLTRIDSRPQNFGSRHRII
jgi:hypothetical protein